MQCSQYKEFLTKASMCDVFAVATDPLGDVLSFIDEFEQLYGANHPEFYRGTYSQVSFASSNRCIVVKETSL